MSGLAGLLLLGDGRFPTGGHAHSAGVEAAVADGRVSDLDSLAAFTRGRLHTAGVVEAVFAVATAQRLRGADNGEWPSILELLDDELDARLLSPPLRDASRRLGRQLARSAGRCWPDPLLAEVSNQSDGLHQPVVLGAVGVVLGAGDGELATVALHHAASTPLQAGVRLLGLDPYAIAALVAASVTEAFVDQVVDAARRPVEQLPAWSGPLVELASITHQSLPGRLFAT